MAGEQRRQPPRLPALRRQRAGHPDADHRHGLLDQAQGLVLTLTPGDTFRSPRGTVVEVLAYGPDRLAIRRTLPPGTGRTAPHRHLEEAVERFTLLEGDATAKVAGETQWLRAGDVLEIPRATAHVHPHTGPGQTATLEHVIEPCPRFPAVYFPSWLRWLAEGRVDGQDEPTLLGIMSVIDAAKGDSWVAGPPIAVQKAVAKVLAPVAARRGLRAQVD